MKQVRFEFLDTIFEKIERGEDILFVSPDFTGYFKFDDFRKNHPQRFVSVGIAEQNMVGVASGLALGGKKAIAWAPPPFPVLRAFDQIKNAACLMNLPVLFCESGKPIAEFGFTHFGTERVSLLRTLPNLRIVNVTDTTIARKLAESAFELGGPVYAFFDHECTDTLYVDVDFERGFGILREGNCDVAVVSTSFQSVRCLKIVDELAKEGISCKLIDVYSFPYNDIEFVSALGDIRKVVVVEENIYAGGLGSAVLETLTKAHLAIDWAHLAIDWAHLAIDWAMHLPLLEGDRYWLLEKLGLGEENIKRTIRGSVNNK